MCSLLYVHIIYIHLLYYVHYNTCIITFIYTYIIYVIMYVRFRNTKTFDL